MVPAELTSPSGPRQKQCWRCGEPFPCGPGQTGQTCWCDAVPALLVIDAEADCLCQVCLESAVRLEAEVGL